MHNIFAKMRDYFVNTSQDIEKLFFKINNIIEKISTLTEEAEDVGD